MKTKFQKLVILNLFGFVSTLLCLSPLSHAATNIWTGLGGDNFWTSAANWTNNSPPVAGDDLEFPSGAARLSNTNDFPAGTTFNSIKFSAGNYSLSGSNIFLNAGINATNTSLANYFYIPLTLNSNQTITSGNANVNLYVYGAIDTNGKDLTFAGNGSVQLNPVLSGAGGLIKSGSGNVLMYASNTFSGPVQILQGGVSIYNGGGLGTTNGNTTVSNGANLTFVNSITVPEALVLAGTLHNGTGGKILTGPVTLVGTNVTIAAASGAALRINALVSGNGGFTKIFGGGLTLSSNNTYTGATILSGGSLQINGSQPATPVVLTIGTFTGTGTVATVTATTSGGGGSGSIPLSPGGDPTSYGGAGILICSNLALNASVALVAELNGPSPGSGYDQLNVNGSVALSNALLYVTLGFTPSLSNNFVIIKNDGSDAVNGTFAGLAEGATLTNGATVLRVSYTGGDGNDVTLTTISGTPPSTLTSIVSLPNSFKQLTGQGQSNLIYTIHAASNLNPVIQWSNIGVSTANSGGVFSFTDTNAPLFPMRFYRALSP